MMWLLIYSSPGSPPQCPLRASPALRPPAAAVSPHHLELEARGGWKRRQLTGFQLADARLSRAGGGISSGFTQHLPGQGRTGGPGARLEMRGAAGSRPTPTCPSQGDGHPRRGGPGQF